MGNLYKAISKLCSERGITGYRMCRDVGIQPSIMTDLKSGRKKGLSADVASKIASYLNVSVGFLLGLEEEDFYTKKTSKAICAAIIDAQQKSPELFEHFMIPPDIQAQIEQGTYRFSSVTFPQFGKVLGRNLESFAAQKEKTPTLTEKDRRDVAKNVERIMSDLQNSGDLMFDGVPMSEEAKASMASAMRIGLEEARKRNKETYTPKKYKKR